MKNLKSIKLAFTFLLCLLYPLLGRAGQEKVEFSYLTNKEGLSNSQVNAIWQDRDGFVWLGTQSGLNRYDGFRIKTYLYNNMDNTSIPNNAVQEIQEDNQGNLWIHTSVGYCVFDPHREIFKRDITGWLKENGIPGKPDKVFIDSKKNMWLIIYGVGYYFLDTSWMKTNFFPVGKKGKLPSLNVTGFTEVNGTAVFALENGTLCRLDGARHRVMWMNNQLTSLFKLKATGAFLHTDNMGNYWVLSNGDAFIYDVKHRHWYQGIASYLKSLGITLPVNKNILVRDMAKANDGKLWIASDHDGLFLCDFKEKSCRQFLKDASMKGGVSDNSLQCLFVDHRNAIWVGSYSNGVSYHSPDFSRFSTIPLGDVCTITEDLKGNYWCGTNDAGIVSYNPRTGQMQHYDGNVTGLKTEVIVSSVTLKDGTMFFGTFNGGMVRYRNGQWKVFTPSATGLSNNNVWSLAVLPGDNQERLLIGTLGGGFQIMDTRQETFVTLNTQNSKLASDYINSLSPLSANEVLVGHSQNFSIINVNNHQVTNIQQTKDGKMFASPSASDVIRDSRGIYWLATPAGINMYDPKSGQFENINELNGTQGAVGCSVVEDKAHTIWLISEFIVTHIKLMKNENEKWDLNMVSYNSLDGLQDRQFNYRSAFVARNGDVILGGKNGVNIIHPQELHAVHHASQARFSGFLLFDHLVRAGEKYEGKVLFDETLDICRKLDLSYKDNSFTIQLSSSDVTVPSRSRFLYRMEGMTDKWMMTAEGNPNVTFTNLASGNYTLQVKVVNADGSVNDEISTLKIRIRPPFYLSTWAMLIYLLLIAGALWMYRSRMLEKQREKFEREKMEENIRKTEELNELKLNFFTNVSHELRTPLILIISPLVALMKDEPDETKKRKMELIHRNAVRLLNLVNQILDFRKVENDKGKLTLNQVNVVSFVENICSSFKILANNKITLEFHSSVPKLLMSFDVDKLGKIINNLLSNAYKFTPDGGKVTVSLNVMMEGEVEGIQQDTLRLSVADTGRGISDADKRQIFERFYQVNGTEMQPYGGSGIGLNLVMKFAKLHGGMVHVEDNPGGGSVFVVDVPIRHETTVTETPVPEHESPSMNQDNLQLVGKKPLILLVDDSDDFREFMSEVLTKNYQVIEAVNGKEAMKKLQVQRPDVILSDVMMPEMDGNELCRRVKDNPDTASIPFVMLTARLAEEHKKEGYANGADAYVTKPFDIDLLDVRIKNLLKWSNPKLVAELENNDTGLQTDKNEYVMTEGDKKFVKEVDAYIHDNLGDAEASVEAMSAHLCISRVQLYKRMVSLTGTTPSEYMRAKRIKRAEELLRTGEFTVSEIAYKVGFNNPRYFSKYFQEIYGMTPSQYKKKIQ